MSEIIYAIDFGTSNSLLGAAELGQAHGLAPLDPAAADPTIFRSIIYFGSNREQHFGEAAIGKYVENAMAGRLLRSFKRFLPLQSFESTVINGKTWKLEDLIASFLRQMRERANAHYGQDVKAAVFGRPALFSEDAASDRLAQTRLESAAKKAGFESIEFLPEPVAAAYRYRLELEREETILVADYGGGTSDYTVLKLSRAPFKPEDVLAIGGAPVAGDALDGAVMKHRIARCFGSEVSYTVPFGSNIMTMPTGLMSYLCSTAHIQLLTSRENQDFLSRVRTWSLGKDDRRTMDQLQALLEHQQGFSVFEAIERGKRQLSQGEQGLVDFHFEGEIDISEKIRQSEFTTYTELEVGRIFGAMDETLKKAGLKPADVDRVCCTGGTARASVVRHELLKRFEPGKLDQFRTFTSIVEGLSERGRQLLGG